MAKFQNPYELMLERLQLLDHSIHVLNLVNSDLREILHKRYARSSDLFFSFMLAELLVSLCQHSFKSHSKDQQFKGLEVHLRCRLLFLLLNLLVRGHRSAVRDLKHVLSTLESEEMRVAASIIDKAKRTIEVSAGRPPCAQCAVLRGS